MSHVSVPQAEEYRAPATVRTAATVMVVMVGLGLASAVTTLIALDDFDDGYHRRASAVAGATGQQISDTATAVKALLVGSALTALLFALAMAVLALGVLFRRSVARAGAWLVSIAGLLLAAGGLIVATGGAVGSLGVALADDGAAAATARLLDAAVTGSLPGWWTSVAGVVSAVGAGGYVVVAALLAAPSARGHFRAAPRVWRSESTAVQAPQSVR